MKQAWVLVLGLGFILALFFLQNFPPSLSEVKFANLLPIHLPYKWHRVIPVSIGLGVIAITWLISENTALILAFTPYFVKLTLFDTKGIIIIFLTVLAIWIYKSYKGVAAIFGTVALILLLSNLHIPKYNSNQMQLEVNNRVREETVISNYRDVVPLWFKRIAYNKWFFSYQFYSMYLLEQLNFDKLVSPSEQGVTIARNLWGKDFPDIFFWEIPLVLYFLYKRKVTPKPIMGLIVGAVVVIGSLPYYHHFLSHELIWRSNRPYVEYKLISSLNIIPDTQHVTISSILDPLEDYYYFEYQKIPNPKQIAFRHFDLSKEASPEGIYIGFPGEFLGSRINKNENNFAVSELPLNMQLLDSFNFPNHVSFGNGDSIWTVKIN